PRWSSGWRRRAWSARPTKAGDPDRQWGRPRGVRGSRGGLSRPPAPRPRRLGPACRFGVGFSRFQWVAAPFRIDPPGLASAAHGPDFAAHVDEVKAAAREFAPGHDVAAVHRRPGVRRGVFDLVTVSGMEMLHRCLRSLAAIERAPGQTLPTRGRAYTSVCCAAQFY